MTRAPMMGLRVGHHNSLDTNPERRWVCEECRLVIEALLNPVECAACGGELMRAPITR